MRRQSGGTKAVITCIPCYNLPTKNGFNASNDRIRDSSRAFERRVRRKESSQSLATMLSVPKSWTRRETIKSGDGRSSGSVLQHSSINFQRESLNRDDGGRAGRLSSTVTRYMTAPSMCKSGCGGCPANILLV